MELLNELPETSTFVSLSDHQSTTPASFFSGPPVLHYHSDRCKVLIREDDLSNAPALSSLVARFHSNSTSSNSRTESNAGTNGANNEETTLEDIDVWVTSAKLFLFSQAHSIGVSIPYPTICLHAIQNTPASASNESKSQSLYMQLLPSNESESVDDEPPDTVSLTIVPTASASPLFTLTTGDEDSAVASEGQTEQTPAQAMFTALSNCSNLHPDPVNDEDEDMDLDDGMGSRLIHAGLVAPGTNDGSLPPPMPGSGGWITADNMHEYFDEEGNWIGDDEGIVEDEESAETGQEQLGPGAGTVRTRDDGELNGKAVVDSKWQRTS